VIHKKSSSISSRSLSVLSSGSESARLHPFSRLLFAMGIAGLSLVSLSAVAQIAPSLGTTGPFAIVSSTFTNGPNVGAQTAITGGICYTTPPVTPPITGPVPVTPCAPQTGVDQGAASAILLGQACTFLGAGAIALDTLVIGANPPGTIPPGCYSSGGAMSITVGSTVTLTGNGVYIFRPGGAVTTGANSRVIMAGGACASNVFWAPAGAVTLGANAAASATPTFEGNILSNAGITIGNFANLNGRALSFAGTVTTAAVTITVPTCAAIGGAGAGNSVPTLSEWMMILLAGILAIAGFAALRRVQK
jgi:hypothetical protein